MTPPDRRSGLFVALALTVVAVGCPESERSAIDPPPDRSRRGGVVEADAGDPAGGGDVADRAAVVGGFVGSERCAACHPTEAARWRGSHHDRAMEWPTPASVLGAFDGRVVEAVGARWRFVRDGDAWVVEHTALAPEAAPTERLLVRATFGVDPLQQLLVERARGRWQALPVAWDARAPREGGGRWRSLHPGESIPVGDPLHWDGLGYNWNSQCAACHSTALHEGYDAATDAFDTVFAAVDVGCEACHGPGAGHVERHAGPGVEGDTGASGDAGAADDGEATVPPDLVRLAPARAEDWVRRPGVRIAQRHAPIGEDHTPDVCAPCHSRRGALVEAPAIGAPYLDGHRPALLAPGLYFDDGQMRDEVYVYGSFVQSRMSAAGVRCQDCHEPHGLGLRRPGNALCGTCHAPEDFDGPAHRGHAADGGHAAEGGRAPTAGESRDPARGDAAPGTACVDCHMPARTYMVIDERRDHAFPVPRPRRSERLGAPDPCLGCHADLGADRAATAIASWRGAAPAHVHWSDALVADDGRGARAGADGTGWLAVATDAGAPDWVRGSAWVRAAATRRVALSATDLAEGLASAGPLERLGRAEAANALAPASRARVLRPLLRDPLRAIRVAAAEALIGVPTAGWSPADRSALGRALGEYRAVQLANAERPEAQANLGGLARAYGDLDAAARAYRRALERSPTFVPAHLELADLARASGDEARALEHLRVALELAPEDGLVRYAWGLALHRRGEREAAAAALAEAAVLAPDRPRVVLGHALALDGLGRRAEAIGVLERALAEGRGDESMRATLMAWGIGPGAPRRD